MFTSVNKLVYKCSILRGKKKKEREKGREREPAEKFLAKLYILSDSWRNSAVIFAV